MLTAALYDIHGNLPALKAVLSEVDQCGVEQIIIGGDVAPGPQPYECMELLLGIDIPMQFIIGNGELSVIDASMGNLKGNFPEQIREVIQWNADVIPESQISLMKEWPMSLIQSQSNGSKVMYCHATPNSATDIYTKQTPNEILSDVFHVPGVPVIICGHTHMQFDLMLGETRLLNAGSVGMPFGPAGADWLLIDDDHYELKHTEYDIDSAAEEIRATKYPLANDFADNNVLNPPSEAKMLDVFSQTAS